jgi:hypothetical protein
MDWIICVHRVRIYNDDMYFPFFFKRTGGRSACYIKKKESSHEPTNLITCLTSHKTWYAPRNSTIYEGLMKHTYHDTWVGAV